MILAALVFAQVLIPLPAENEKWIRAAAPHFTIISSASERETRELAMSLETMAAALQRLHPRFREQPMERSRVLLFARRGEAQPYFDLLLTRGTRSRGAFVAGDEGGTMVLSSGRRLDRTPYHELVHNLMAGPTRPPLWLEEGLAEFYSRVEIRGTRRRTGRTFQGVNTSRFEPIRQMFGVTREAFAGNRFYTQAWAAVDWLLRTNRAAFDPFEADVEKGVDIEVALRKHYNATLQEWERGMAGLSHSSPFVVDAPRIDVAIAIEPMAYADVLYELGSFLGEFESRRPDAERHFRAALESNPRHARALAGLGALTAKTSPRADMRELTDRANALISEQKLDEAVVVVRELAAATSDPAARRELEAQAAQLARTAETKRHILEYERAIEEAKNGDRKGALKRIEALLAVATDEEVLRDAEELRKELLRQ